MTEISRDAVAIYTPNLHAGQSDYIAQCRAKAAQMWPSHGCVVLNPKYYDKGDRYPTVRVIVHQDYEHVAKAEQEAGAEVVIMEGPVQLMKLVKPAPPPSPPGVQQLVDALRGAAVAPPAPVGAAPVPDEMLEVYRAVDPRKLDDVLARVEDLAFLRRLREADERDTARPKIDARIHELERLQPA